MKHRLLSPVGNPGPRAARPARALASLADALLAMRTPREMTMFLDDLCTPAELEAMADRWRVVPLLMKDTPYREIHDRTGVSVTTVSRIARCLSFGSGGYRLAAGRVLGKTDRGRRR